ncbi:MAG: tyrosine-type recombinase/integrase [Streptosporangiaceae bacterium]
MSALPARAGGERRPTAGAHAAAEWAQIEQAAPGLAVTMRRYLAQAATFLAPRSVDAANGALRQLARWILASTGIESVTEIRRDDIEDFKVWLSAQQGANGSLSANTYGQRLRMLRVFFERIIEWDWPDAPPRNPVIGGDIPPRPDPLPRFLDDRDAARLMAAARACADPRDRLVIELLARTGMRAGELADLEADAVVRIGAGYWLRIPLGKLRNDRYVPLHPELVTLLTAWTAANTDHIRACRRLAADHRGPLDRYQIGRIVGRIGRSCGVSVHPHQLRHTLATQAINRGMRLEAIAALLGHRTMEMTLIYARIADRVVADEYQAISEKIDALSGQQLELPADYETTGMAKLRREAHARMLGNGLCTRPVQLDCRMESACETCSYFQTTIEFRPTLERQRDHARDHGQKQRAAIFDKLIQQVDQEHP